MSQQALHDGQTDPVLNEAGGKRMAKRMWRDAREASTGGNPAERTIDRPIAKDAVLLSITHVQRGQC